VSVPTRIAHDGHLEGAELDRPSDHVDAAPISHRTPT